MDILKKKYTRNCLGCKCIIYYSRKDSFVNAEQKNSKCFKCTCIGKSPWNKGLTKETSDLVKQYSEKGSIALTGKKINPDVIKKRNQTRKNNGPWHSEETKTKIRLSNLGQKRNFECRNNMKLSAIKRIQKYKIYNKPNFNPKACNFIDNLNYIFGFNFSHALNGGEKWVKGCWIDGYDKEKNIIFEYDEPWHHRQNQKIKDLNKQQLLINTLNPVMFIRYDEKNKRLFDCLTDIDILTIPL